MRWAGLGVAASPTSSLCGGSLVVLWVLSCTQLSSFLGLCQALFFGLCYAVMLQKKGLCYVLFFVSP